MKNSEGKVSYQSIYMHYIHHFQKLHFQDCYIEFSKRNKTRYSQFRNTQAL